MMLSCAIDGGIDDVIAYGAAQGCRAHWSCCLWELLVRNQTPLVVVLVVFVVVPSSRVPRRSVPCRLLVVR
jgi:hypothetical protein